MTDTSNSFSIEGFNRNKQFSGLHAREPENFDEYYKYENIYVNPQYVGILSTQVESTGLNYTKESSLVFPQPEHPLGHRASGIPIFQMYSDTFTKNSSGSGYVINEALYVYNDNNKEIGDIYVTATGSNGSISSFEVGSIPLYSTDLNGIYVSHPLGNNSAQFVSHNIFSIVGVTMTNAGIGYQTFSANTLTEINHDPKAYPFATVEFDDQTLLDNSYSDPPIGLIARANKDPYLIHTPIPRTIRDAYVSKNVFDERFQYTVVNSMSLGAP
jgi:hypothetical protein